MTKNLDPSSRSHRWWPCSDPCCTKEARKVRTQAKQALEQLHCGTIRSPSGVRVQSGRPILIALSGLPLNVGMLFRAESHSRALEQINAVKPSKQYRPQGHCPLQMEALDLNWSKKNGLFEKVCPTRGFPKIGGTILGVPLIRIIVLGSIVGSPYFGKLPQGKALFPANSLNPKPTRAKLFSLEHRWPCSC